MHDIIEDTEVTIGMILDNFDWRIAEMVDMLTRDRPDGSKLSVQDVLNKAYQKQDEEVLLIKLFDRLHNLQTLDAITDEKKKKVALETLSNFLTLALSFDEKGDQMIAKLCFSYLQLDYSQPSFSFSNVCKLKPIEFDFMKVINP
ncbi:Putative SpoT-like (p)ppGpp synthetase domain protein (plasmid) [Candidatus Megaera polyxenophila]|nr:Putative SpoT-like (p)ppGpp synthetase domain protein [Candidatus Megaera polyxenophila]